jgi:BRCT domain type II-containing protein
LPPAPMQITQCGWCVLSGQLCVHPAAVGLCTMPSQWLDTMHVGTSSRKPSVEVGQAAHTTPQVPRATTPQVPRDATKPQVPRAAPHTTNPEGSRAPSPTTSNCNPDDGSNSSHTSESISAISLSTISLSLSLSLSLAL